MIFRLESDTLPWEERPSEPWQVGRLSKTSSDGDLLREPCSVLQLYFLWQWKWGLRSKTVLAAGTRLVSSPFFPLPREGHTKQAHCAILFGLVYLLRMLKTNTKTCPKQHRSSLMAHLQGKLFDGRDQREAGGSLVGATLSVIFAGKLFICMLDPGTVSENCSIASVLLRRMCLLSIQKKPQSNRHHRC
jgi:hypothetical protein